MCDQNFVKHYRILEIYNIDQFILCNYLDTNVPKQNAHNQVGYTDWHYIIYSITISTA